MSRSRHILQFSGSAFFRVDRDCQPAGRTICGRPMGGRERSLRPEARIKT